MSESREHTRAGQSDRGQRKRLRVSRACDQCRKRRDKCDGQQPSCQGCIDGNRACTYDESTKKRGLPTGYVRALEMMLGFLFHHVDESDHLLATLFGSDESTDLPTTQVNTRKRKRDAADPGVHKSAKSILAVWKQSKAIKQMESFLATSAPEDDESFMQRVDEKLAQLPSSEVNDDDDPDEDIAIDEERPDISRGASNITNTLGLQAHVDHSSLTLPPNWSDLIQDYLAKTHCWFPISQKYDLLRTAHALGDAIGAGEGDQETTTPGDRAFVWAVLAYSSCRREAVQNATRDYDAAPGTRHSTAHLYDGAMKAVKLSRTSRYETGHIRALLVLVLINVGRGHWTTAWGLIGQAIYAAVDIGVIPLDTQGSQTRLSTRATIDDTTRRIALGCFLLDTLVSTRLERRPYLRRSDLQLIGSVEVNGNEEWEALPTANVGRDSDSSYSRNQPGRILSTFNALIQLLGVLNDDLHNIHTEDTTISPAPSLKSSPAPQRLAAWMAGLPTHCRSSCVANGDVSSTPQQINLSLAYECFELVSRARTSALNMASTSEATSHGGLESTPTSRMMLNAAITTPSSDTMAGDIYDRSHKIISFLHKLRNDPSHTASNPLIQVYLWQCGAMCTRTDNLIGQIDQMRKEVEAAWEYVERASTSTSSLPNTNILQPDLLTMPGPGGLPKHDLGPPLTPFSEASSRLNPMNSSHGLLVPANPGSSEVLGTQLDSFADMTAMPSLTPFDMTYGAFPDPLPSDLDGDALFSSLAMLDSVEWPVYQTELMSHLGFMTDSNTFQMDDPS